MTGRPPLRRWLAFGVLAGGLSVLGLARSSWWALVPPVLVPYVPVDLRVLVPFIFVAGAAGASRWLPWPGPGLVPAGAAVSAALVARLPASSVLAAAGWPGARGGLDVAPLGLAASLAAVLVALHMGLEAAWRHAAGRLQARGLPREEARLLARRGRDLARSGTLAAGIVAGGLAAVLPLARGLVGGRTLPLPEVVGVLLVLAVAVVVADWRGLAAAG